MTTYLMINLRWIVRDRILRALAAVALFLVMLVPVISSFSIRQPQELSVTLSLSFVSFTLLVFSVSLGSTVVWRDMERRYTFAVLSLPLERGGYLLAKFFAVSLFLLLSAAVICACSFVAILLSSLSYPSSIPINWPMISLAIGMESLKYILLTSIAILVTTISTSFFMPFFTTLAVYMAGSASQEVFEFITSDAGARLSPFLRAAARGVYYIVPNFSVFNFKLQAVYPLPLDQMQLFFVIAYFITYTTLVLSLAIWIFSKRELT